MAAINLLSQEQFPYKGSESLDRTSGYLESGRSHEGIRGTGKSYAKKYPKLSDEGLDKEYKKAHGIK